MIVRFESLGGTIYEAEVLSEGDEHYLIMLDQEPCWISKNECEIVVRLD